MLLGRPNPKQLEAEDRTLDPQGKDKHLTLAEILDKKARHDNVTVRVMIFNELSISLPNNSEYASKQLLSHPNIRVLRHPQGVITLWSHHEKLCIVDQSVAYIGGIDLAFGRYDTPAHPINDSQMRMVPGKDLYNPRVAGFEKLEEPHEPLFDRTVYPRMPWHDITFCVTGPAAQDAAQHFVQRWNNHVKEEFTSVAAHQNLQPIASRDYLYHTNKDSCCFLSR